MNHARRKQTAIVGMFLLALIPSRALSASPTQPASGPTDADRSPCRLNVKVTWPATDKVDGKIIDRTKPKERTKTFVTEIVTPMMERAGLRQPTDGETSSSAITVTVNVNYTYKGDLLTTTVSGLVVASSRGGTRGSGRFTGQAISKDVPRRDVGFKRFYTPAFIQYEEAMKKSLFVDSAARAIADATSTDVCDLLLALLSDWQHKYAAADALSRLKDPRAVGPMLRKTEGQEPLRIVAMGTVAIPALERELMAEAISRKKGEPEQQMVWARVSAALVLFGKDATPALVRVLKGGGDKPRAIAAAALAKTKDPAALDALIETLGDQNPNVRMNAAIAIGNFNDDRAIKALIVATTNEDRHVREQATKGLGEIRSKKAIPALWAIVKKGPGLGGSYESILYREAIDSLGKIGLPAAKELISLLGDRDGMYKAFDALAQISDPSLIPMLVAAIKNPSSKARAGVCAVLAQLADNRQLSKERKETMRTAVPALLDALADPEADVRDSAAHALHVIADKRAAAPLRKLAQSDPSPSVRMRARNAAEACSR